MTIDAKAVFYAVIFACQIVTTLAVTNLAGWWT
jgi:hypothetical protein